MHPRRVAWAGPFLVKHQRMAVYLGSGPDWTSIVTAVSTAILAIGVLFAAFQFFWQRKADRVVETGKLIDMWNSCACADDRDRLDKHLAIEDNRAMALRVYIAERHGKNVPIDIDAILTESARLAERIEIYIRKGAANESIIAETIGYDILQTYFVLHNIMAADAKADNIDYEGFRDLASRMQDYAKLKPLDTGWPDELLALPIPVIQYRDGTHSLGYIAGLAGFWRLIRLGVLGYMYDFSIRKRPQYMPKDTSKLEERVRAICDIHD